MNSQARVAKIVSGGQTGADQGALDAALEIGIPCGGWCPQGRRSEAGPIPERYPLTETHREDYLFRTEQNVVDSEATLVFTYGAPQGGSKKTIEFAIKRRRPHLHVDLNQSDDDRLVEAIHAWLSGDGPQPATRAPVPRRPVLNVAGSRESERPGIHDRVKGLLIKVLG